MPAFRVKPDDYTVLMAHDAELSDGLRRQPAGHGKFPVTDRRRPDQTATWHVTVASKADYAASVLLFRRGDRPVRARVACAGRSVSAILPSLPVFNREWRREPPPGTLRLARGPQTLALQAWPVQDAGLDLDVFSIELVRPGVRDRLHRAALRQRADTAWFHRARYGFMCHWTSESFPRRGERKPYAQAVREFDVERFADQVKEGGAGFVVFTTAHAEQYFPAPLAALSRVLPGRTASRDLVADLAEALAKRGIRLMLYYNPGSGADPAWLDACGFWQTDTTRLFDTWTGIAAEAGERYGILLDGPCKGLQASACLIAEGDWVHSRAETEIGAPRWTAGQLAAMLRQFAAYRNVPIFNLEIYQDGSLSPGTIGVFAQARRDLDTP